MTQLPQTSYQISDTNLHIFNSYRTPKRYMRTILVDIRGYRPNSGVWSRSLGSLVAEWKAHNVCYKLGILRSCTGDVDLDTGEPCWRLLAYRVVATLFGWILD